jgi:L,D-peptidoglycan transpeptidase YkuD (ErfK/YbiS/YcfS/YnhG family)
LYDRQRNVSRCLQCNLTRKALTHLKKLANIALMATALVLQSCSSREDNVLTSMGCRQLVVVTTADWNATNGTMRTYERFNNHWKPVLGPIPVTVGRNGLTWGKGLQDDSINQPPLKTEGDGKSPAGLFTLDSLYGYEALQAKMDYLVVDSNTFCVDDPKSKHYNQIVHGDEVGKDWDSAETMLMQSDAYKYGIVVGYNREPVVPGAGSCIFFHLGKPNGTTAGCTAMPEGEILKLIKFLDKEKIPVLAQAPEEDYAVLAKRYNLPLPQK